MFRKLISGALTVAVVAGASISAAQAEDTLYIPSLSYRTGPFAGGGIPFANGFHDYLAMLNARDGGIGGAKIVIEECETAYNAQKGVECYEATKGNGALVYNPLSTGITLQLIPKALLTKFRSFRWATVCLRLRLVKSSLGPLIIQHPTGRK